MNIELNEEPSTILLIDSPNTSATETISNLLIIFEESTSIVSQTIILDNEDWSNRSIAGPDNTGWVAIAVTDIAPF